MSRICSYTGSNHIFLAAAVELIHAATLLHDDVVDQSSTRRSKPTANFIWDNKASILVGDFLFSQAFKLMVKSESIEALQSLSEASAIIAEGEVMQLARLYENRMLTVEEYEIIASAKTAALFAASSHVGAIIADQPAQVREAARNFGAFLGLIFQVKDDMLDYFANPNVTGKNLADDLTQGNITIPIILAYDKASLDVNLSFFTKSLNVVLPLYSVKYLIHHLDLSNFIIFLWNLLFTSSSIFLSCL
jgi:octaprenyl-diphosphate synthase